METVERTSDEPNPKRQRRDLVDEVDYRIGVVTKIYRMLERLDGLDESTRARISDYTKNTLLMLSDTWSVPMRARELGVKVAHNDWVKLSRAATRAYRRRYGCDPKCGKKPDISGETGVPVWHYTEAECEECVDGAIHGFGK